MATYENLARLRQALSSDDPDDRAEAYGDVIENDVKPSEILETPPDDAKVQMLRDADVLPEEDPGGPRVAANEQRKRIIELLEEIAGTSGGDSA